MNNKGIRESKRVTPNHYYFRLTNPKYLSLKHKAKSVILLDESPWPLLLSIGVSSMLTSLVLYLNLGNISSKIVLFYLLIGLCVTIYTFYMWTRDLIREGTILRRVSKLLEKSLRLAMILFIISEVFFFISFFWAFFHSSLSPSIEIGCIWPPKYIGTLNYMEIPLLNTIILLFSGITVTVSHHKLIIGELNASIKWLNFTIINAFIFLLFQGYEYFHASFNIAMGIYPSVFYMATGFHGFHVLLGAILLWISLVRMEDRQFTSRDHFGFISAAWYYHFVDVVWLFLFLFIYVWGS